MLKFGTGCEAIANGALQAGICFATSYPGTPASEILTSILEAEGSAICSAEWSINEKVALEAAAAASISGRRALCAMKHYGLNVASDFLASLALTDCCKGGLVVVVGDDPEGHASRSEQDSRHYAKMFDIPLLEPSTLDEARTMTGYAFEVSEYLALPVIVRCTTRLLHSLGVMEECTTNGCSKESSDFYIPHRLFSSPAVRYHRLLHEKMERCQDVFIENSFNTYEQAANPCYLVICSGSGYPLIKEAVNTLNYDIVSILKLGTIWPVPEKIIIDAVKEHKHIVFLEEVDPFIEDALLTLIGRSPGEFADKSFYGKRNNLFSGQRVPGVGELAMECVEEGLKTIINDETNVEARNGEISYQKEPISGGFCAGCPHRASFYTLRQAVALHPFDVTVLGDIGCYTQGIGSTGYNVLQTVFCMGASVGLASSLGRFGWTGKKRRIVSVAGDSTFFHSCIPGLIEIQHRQSPVTVVILDNFVSAMTGGQETPETPAFNIINDGTSPVLIESILKGIGLPFFILDPFDIDNNITVICHLLDQYGPHVVVFRSPCALYKKHLPGQPVASMQIDNDICINEACGCNTYCYQVYACPAIKISGEANKPCIDTTLCIGCGACQTICPAGAILSVARKGQV